MIEIDNRKVDLTPEIYAQLGEPKRMHGSTEMIVVERGGVECWRGSAAQYYRNEERLRICSRREGVEHGAYMLFENGRVRL